MTASVPQAYTALRARLDTNFTDLDRFYQNENFALPDEPEPFVFALIQAQDQRLAATGGGRLNNRYRNFGTFEVYVLVPVGYGLQAAVDYAEQIGNIFRSQAFDGVHCGAALVAPNAFAPSGMKEAAGNYYASAVFIEFYSDQIG